MDFISSFVKSLYFVLELARSIAFPLDIIWNSCILSKVSFFYLGSRLGKSIDVRLAPKRCFLCKINGELIGHNLLRCAKSRVLRNLLLFLFRIVWVSFPRLEKLFQVGMILVLGENKRRFGESLYAFFEQSRRKELNSI